MAVLAISSIRRRIDNSRSCRGKRQEVNKLCNIRQNNKAAKTLDADKVTCDDNIAKVSIVGVGMRSHTGVASKMFGVLAKNKINIDMISTSEIKISCVVRGDKGKEAVQMLHKECGLGKK